MKKRRTLKKYLYPLVMLLFAVLVNIDLYAQSIQKNDTSKKQEEILTRIDREVKNVIHTKLQNLQTAENSQSILTKSSNIKNVPVRAAISESDSLILVNFFNATDGENWTNNTNWLTGPVNTWYGITIESDLVTEIRLKDNNLFGEIPANLGQLISLEYLALDTNQLIGAIPAELGNLSQLEFLYLNGNQLTGNIPTELLQLSNLELFYLSDNQLSGTIPDGFEQLSGLRWLDLSHNQFSGSIPVEFGQFPLLEFLDLGQNQFTDTIPFALGQLTNLRWLVLSQNQLTGKIPIELGNLTNLEQLYLDGNLLNDTIPSELSLLTNMIWLNLGQNQLTGTIPSELEQLLNLNLLYLNENQLSGSIPIELGQLQELKWVDFGQNLLTGNIPDELWQIPNLEFIYLNSNQLEGSLSAQIGQISGLYWVNLSQNNLTGEVPDEINQLTNLEIFDINSNQFSYLPEITTQIYLSYIDVSNNNLSFEDLEYNMDLGLSIDFLYAPQDSIGESQTIAKKPGTTFSYAAPTGGEQNNYQWYKNDALLDTQTGSELILNNLAYEDSGKYYCVVTNNVVADLTLTSRKFTLKVDESAETCQKLVFNEGWQIFSAPVTPDSADMKFLFQPLIDNSSLIKIQDEEGNAVEDYGFLGGWRNFIGDISPDEGYKLRVTSKDSIEICGEIVDFPYVIPLKAGWNIIGFPHNEAVDAMEIIQPLIDNNNLEKVQDEKGNAIEDFGFLGGWKNFIGDFIPGKGYKVKLSAVDTIEIQSVYEKSVSKLPQSTPTVYFQPTFINNGVDHMNINITQLSMDLFQPGDELAVFDGDLCVGAVTLMPHHFNDQIVSIAASAADQFGMPGFKEGNLITLKLYNSQQDKELDLEPEIWKGTSKFVKHESAWMNLKSFTTNMNDQFSGETEIQCFPNPSDSEVIIELMLRQNENIKLEIYNHLGQQIKTLSNEKLLLAGSHRFIWDAMDQNNQKVSSGVYIVVLSTQNSQQFSKIIVSN